MLTTTMPEPPARSHMLRRLVLGAVAVLILLGLAGALLLRVVPGAYGALVGPFFPSGGSASVRVNQVGYLVGEGKRGVLLASRAEVGATFAVTATNGGRVVYRAPVGQRLIAWSAAFPYAYPLDFNAVTAPGAYVIRVSGTVAAVSAPFRVGSAAQLYAPLLANALFFYQAQHDSPTVNAAVLDRQPSHLADATASVYATPSFTNGALASGLTRVGGPVDVAGGWFDAGDYLKFVETASYTDAILLLAARDARDAPEVAGAGAKADFAAEGRYGLDWLQKMWDEGSRTLYYQVGIGDGNGGSILGDHDSWRLPQSDDQLNTQPGDPAYYVQHRPVLWAGPAGAPISPNLAGRLAADFALCYQVFAASDPAYAARCLASAETVYGLAKTSQVGQLVTTAPYDYYGETSWRDDMELGASELALAVAQATNQGDPTLATLPHADPAYYLAQAARWASAYIHGPDDGTDTLNLYDVSGLAHYELARALAQPGAPTGLALTRQDLVADLGAQLASAAAQAQRDPFGLGVGYTSGDLVPHALGLALMADEYDTLTGATTYRAFGEKQRDWVLGANAWGVSFVVGAGAVFPLCLHHQIANLAGSLRGPAGGSILLGATVDGPQPPDQLQGLSLPDGARPCSAPGDPYRAYAGQGVTFADNAADYPCVEPADDYTALTVLLFAHQG